MLKKLNVYKNSLPILWSVKTQKRIMFMYFEIIFREFPGGSVVSPWHFTARAWGSVSSLWIKVPQAGQLKIKVTSLHVLHFRGWGDSGIWVNLTWITLFLLSRKNTEIPCLRPVFSNRSFVSVRSVRPTLASMTMTVVLQTTSGASYTWDSFRSVRSSIS